jgi:hypothetical protein
MEENMVLRRMALLAFCLVLLYGGNLDAAGGKISLVDSIGESQGTAKVKLEKGSVRAKFALAPLPADIDTGTEQFQATIYKAYLANSTDAAVEIPLGSVWPSTKSKAKLKVALKGDLSGLGLDRLVIVAFSNDGLDSFDVLTGTIETP